jgi:C-terminal processing protease CtpA/Prc
MRHALEQAHGGIYRYTSKTDMDRTFDRAYRKIDHPMTALEFWRLAASVVAHIKCGHSYLFFPKTVQTQLLTTLPLFPLVTRIFDNRLYGYRDLANPGSSLEGAELLSINHMPVKKLLKNLRTVVNADGNTPIATDYFITPFTNFRFYLYGFGIESPFRVEYRDKTGKRRSATLAGVEQSKANQAWNARNPESATAPNADLKFVDSGRIAVITIRHWYRYADENRKLTFSDFLKTSFAQIRQNGTANLIIDVRDDDGGLDLPVVELFAYLWNQPFHVYRDITCNAREFDFFKYDPDAKPMPDKLVKGADGELHVVKQTGLDLQQPLQPHYAGRVFALMNGGSFSSSTEFLTLLHFYKRAKFIGEEPAGAYYGYTCGRMVSPILPNSKLELDFGILTFYLDVSGYKHPDRGVMPDYPVAYTIADLLAGRDKDMELALSLAREKQQ